MEEIQRMQDNLLLIRRTIGWTAAEFGDQIGEIGRASCRERV